MGETILLVIIAIIAAIYLGRRFYLAMKGQQACSSCSCCSSHCKSKEKKL